MSGSALHKDSDVQSRVKPDCRRQLKGHCPEVYLSHAMSWSYDVVCTQTAHASVGGVVPMKPLRSRTFLTFAMPNYWGHHLYYWSCILHDKSFFSLCYYWTRLWNLDLKQWDPSQWKPSWECVEMQSISDNPNYFNKQGSTMSNSSDESRKMRLSYRIEQGKQYLARC